MLATLKIIDMKRKIIKLEELFKPEVVECAEGTFVEKVVYAYKLTFEDGSVITVKSADFWEDDLELKEGSEIYVYVYRNNEYIISRTDLEQERIRMRKRDRRILVIGAIVLLLILGAVALL